MRANTIKRKSTLTKELFEELEVRRKSVEIREKLLKKSKMNLFDEMDDLLLGSEREKKIKDKKDKKEKKETLIEVSSMSQSFEESESEYKRTKKDLDVASKIIDEEKSEPIGIKLDNDK